jgi:hypothetical protein
VGKAPTEQILSLIYWKNLIVMRKILRVWLNARVECLLVVLILCFAYPAYGIDINLRWDPNVEPDLSGYKIYYKTGSPGPPYNGWGALEGDSPIEIDAYQVLIGNACEFTISDLDGTQVYYFVVTAFDTECNESDYSNEVSFNCGGQPDYPTISDMWPLKAEPRTRVILFGSGFGDTQQDSVVNIGRTQFDLDHGKLEFWSDAIIEITIPFGLKECEWFIDGDGTYREQNVWVTVDGVDSNEKALKVMKPETCP